MNVLQCHPVDLFIIECGHWQCPKPPLQGHRWEKLIDATAVNLRPNLIIEVWPPNSLLWENGPTGKGTRVGWEHRGYDTKMKVIDSQHCGGAFVQPRALIIRD